MKENKLLKKNQMAYIHLITKVFLATAFVLFTFSSSLAEEITCTYLDVDGKLQSTTAIKFESLSSDLIGTDGKESWYFVTGTVSLSDELSINGNVHLILTDDATLYLNNKNYGIFIKNNSSLTIYSQSYGDKMGKLTSGETLRTNNALTINGGFITVNGKNNSIYGSFTFNGGKLVINSGDISYGDVTIGHHSPNDFVQINSLYNSTVRFKKGHFYATEDGTVLNSTISASDFNNNYSNKKLSPLPTCKVTINDTYISNVIKGATINGSDFKDGYTITNIKDENNNDFDISTAVNSDLNLTATFVPIVYTINYVVGNNASNNSANPATYTIETETFSLQDPSGDNCEFLGWTYNGQSEPIKEVTIPKGSFGNKTFTAKWNYYYFDANGNRQTTTDATQLFSSIPNTLGQDGKDTWYVVTGNISLSKTLYIHGNVHLVLANNTELNVKSTDYGCFLYSKSSLTVYSQSYDDNMGKMTIENINTTVGTAIRTNNAFTINGGIITAKTNSASNNYDIYGSFTFNGGRLVANTGMIYGTATIGYNSLNDYVQINMITGSNVQFKTGKAFVSYYGEVAQGLLSVSDFNNTFSGKKLMPLPICKVTINDNQIFYIPKEEKLTSSTVGYAISNIKYENGSNFDANTPITSDLSLTATLGAPQEYSITYNLGNNAINNAANPTSYNIATESFKLQNPRREGYVFVGWKLGENTPPSKNVSITQGSIGNKVFNAVWKEGGFSYLDADGIMQWADATELTSTDDFGATPHLGIATKETWYIVTNNITLPKDQELYFYGNVNLIIADNAELKVNSYWTMYSPSAVYSQSYGDKMGRLTINSATVAIRTNDVFTINGCLITPKGNNMNNDIYGSFTFNGGRLVSTSGSINGNATIGHNSPNDFVQIKKFADNKIVRFKEGKFFITPDGEVVGGEISAADFNKNYSNIVLRPCYSVTYILGEGVEPNASNPDYYTVDTETFTLVNPTRDGYTFLGWTYEGQTEPIKTVTIPKGSYGNKEFTANWVKPMTDVDVANIAAQTYTGSAITPKITVTDGEKTLTLGTDYTVSYSDNTNVGTAKATITGIGNYTGSIEKNFTILPAPVTVTAENKSKTFGESDPEFTAKIEGLVNNESSDLIKYTFSRTEGENAGEYVITPNGEEIQGNYVVTFVDGKLTINPAPITVTAEAKSKTFGESDPEFTAKIEGLVNNESPDLIKYTFSRTEGENVGEYTITAKGDEKQGNYVVTFVDGKLAINENPNTPVSSIDNNGNNVKVWSYAHTIYIASAPDSQYKIIDLQGRTIKSATTKSSYEEVSINNSGIYVVIINGKSYKVSL